MYDRILFPTDGSEPAASALDYALRVAAEHDSTVHVLNVVDTSRDDLVHVQEDAIDALERTGEQIVAEAARYGSEQGIPVVSDVVRGVPSTSIVEYSQQYDADLIVMPTHGRRGLKRFLVGSVTERVINTAELPVVTVNRGHDQSLTYPCREVLVPTDGSRGAELAVAEGVAVAKATGATIHLLHVVETGNLGPETRSGLREGELTERANAIVTAAAETANAASVDAVENTIEFGYPARKIRSYIQEHGIDLAVLGTHGATDFSRYMMGGVSSKLVRTSPIPVLWVREPASDAAE